MSCAALTTAVVEYAAFLVAVVIVALAAVSSEELVDSLIAVLVSAPFSILFH